MWKRVLLAAWLAGAWVRPAVTEAIDWPHWRGPDENGMTREVLPDPPKLRNVVWKKRVGIGFSSMAVADGRVLTMGHGADQGEGHETVWCFDAKTGGEIWKDTYPAPLIDRFYEGGPGATPTVRGGKVYSYSKHGRLHCYRADTGKRLWQRDMMREAGLRRTPEWGFAGSPYFVDGKLVIEAGATIALDPESGKVLWKSRLYTPAYGTPRAFALEGRTLLAVLKTEGLVVLDAADGATVDTAEWKTSFDTSATTPIVHDNRIFISTGYDRGCALFELTDGRLRKLYENRTMSNHMNNSVLIDGHLYGFDGTAHRGRPSEFVCMEFATGREKWRVPPREGLGCGSVMADGDNTLLLLSERGELLAAPANPEGFKVANRAHVLGGKCWTVPVLSNGRIYARNARGDLVCIAVE